MWSAFRCRDVIVRCWCQSASWNGWVGLIMPKLRDNPARPLRGYTREITWPTPNNPGSSRRIEYFGGGPDHIGAAERVWHRWLTHLPRTMMTSSNGNIFRVTGPLCGEFTGPGEFPTQRPVTRSFDVFFDLRLNKRLSKQPWGWWFETSSWSLWRQCNENGRHIADDILDAF